MMQFDEYIAGCYGVNEAILVEVLRNLIRRNEELNESHYEGKYWVRITLPELRKEVPFWDTNAKVGRILLSLCNQGVVKKANFNSMIGQMLDQTNWYTLTDKADL